MIELKKDDDNELEDEKVEFEGLEDEEEEGEDENENENEEEEDDDDDDDDDDESSADETKTKEEIVYSSEAEDSDDAVFNSEKTNQEKSPTRKRNMLILAGILLLLLALVYKIFSFIFSETKGEERASVQTQTIEKLTSPSVSQADVAKSLPPVASSPIVPIISSAPKTESEKPVVPVKQLQEVDNLLAGRLKAQEEESQKHLASVQKDIVDLQSTTGKLQTAIKTLNAALNVSLEKQRVEEAKRQQEQKAKDRAVVARKQYFVEAVIPGRAWLKGLDGSAMTVSVGEVIQGYGKITGIDSYSGTVHTESNQDIRYAVT